MAILNSVLNYNIFYFILGNEILKNKEREVCCQVSHCVTLVNNLARMSVSPGTSSETIFKLLSTLYGTLNSLTKYFINRSSKLDPAFQRAR